MKIRSLSFFFIKVDIKMEKNKDNRLVIIVKIEKYIEYMLIILLKLPRIEKFSIGTEVKTSMYEMLKNVLLASKIDKNKRLQIYNVVDSNIYYQRICNGKFYFIKDEFFYVFKDYGLIQKTKTT